MKDRSALVRENPTAVSGGLVAGSEELVVRQVHSLLCEWSHFGTA
jgi:hypothetical protein